MSVTTCHTYQEAGHWLQPFLFICINHECEWTPGGIPLTQHLLGSHQWCNILDILDHGCGYSSITNIRSHNNLILIQWASKDISGMRLRKGNGQLVSSSTSRRPTRQTGNMASSETFTGLASEADCLFLSHGISRGPPNSGQNWDHTLWRILPREGCSNWWCPGCDMFWTEN